MFVDAGDYGAGVGVEAVDGVILADGLDFYPDGGLRIYVGFGGDFAGDYYQAGEDYSLARNAASVSDIPADVENGVGNLVGDLVGMALGD